MAALRLANLAVRFLLELAALIAIGYWAATIDASLLVRTFAAFVVVLGVALFWGLFVSPKARYSTGRTGQVWLGLMVFLAAAVALAARDHATLGAAFAVAAVVSSLLLYVVPQ